MTQKPPSKHGYIKKKDQVMRDEVKIFASLPDDHFVDTQVAQQILDISRIHVYRLIKNGVLTAYRLGGMGQLRLKVGELRTAVKKIVYVKV